MNTLTAPSLHTLCLLLLLGTRSAPHCVHSAYPSMCKFCRPSPFIRSVCPLCTLCLLFLMNPVYSSCPLLVQNFSVSSLYTLCQSPPCICDACSFLVYSLSALSLYKYAHSVCILFAYTLADPRVNNLQSASSLLTLCLTLLVNTLHCSLPSPCLHYV